jgi:NitT/TauT family transport system substrate-binding protein
MSRFIVALVLVLSLLLAPLAQAAEKIVGGTVGSASALLWAHIIGAQKGFFTEENIDFDMQYIPASAAVMQQLTGGALNMAVGTGLVDPIRAIDNGSSALIVRIEGQTPPYVLMAKPEIATLSDLKGKLISLGGAKDITRIYVERMLAANGVQPGAFDMVFAGATSARFAALESGAVDAAIVTAPFNFRAEAAGFRNLGLVVDYVKDLPFSAIVVDTGWGQSHTELVRRFLAAYTKSIAWFYDDKNRDEAITILANATNADPKDIALSYDFFRKIAFFEPSGKVSRARLGNVVQVLQQFGDVDPALTVDRLVMPGVTEMTD